MAYAVEDKGRKRGPDKLSVTGGVTETKIVKLALDIAPVPFDNEAEYHLYVNGRLVKRMTALSAQRMHITELNNW